MGIFDLLKGSGDQNPSDKQKQKLIKSLKSYGWDEPDKIISLIEPTVVLHDGGKVEAGSSKLGGQPDLPSDWNWAMYENSPMVFLAQINLKELSEFDIENILPDAGMLYFFAHFKAPENKYGSEYLFHPPKEEYRVLFYDGETQNLKEAAAPDNLSDQLRFKAMPLLFQLKYKIPLNVETWKIENAGLTEEDMERYEELTYEGEFNDSEIILGTPSPIQYGVDYDWAYSYLEVDFDKQDMTEENFKGKVDSIRPQFINLLSFTMMDRFESIGIPNCYFGITKDDLAKRNFGNTKFIMQNT